MILIVITILLKVLLLSQSSNTVQIFRKPAEQFARRAFFKSYIFMKQLKFYFMFVAAMFCLELSAQRYEPTTTWPYVYEEFIPGKITTYQGGFIEYDKVNINLINGRVHYVQNGKIMQADVNTIALLTIGQDSYFCVGGKMAKVLKNAQKGAVLLSTGVDVNAMSRSDIGYGNSAIASTQNMSMTALNSSIDSNLNRSLDDLRGEKTDGDPLAIQEIRGMYYKGKFVPASRVDVLKLESIDKDAVKAFIKSEKIKFNKVDDLVKLLDFLYTM